MENQKFKRGRKKKSRKEEQNQNAELYVLPPNLLEQLGIELGQTTRKNDSIRTDLETCMNNNPGTDHLLKDTTLEKSTSLSETASLTKKSIFLSPTFSHYDEGACNNSTVEYIKDNDIAIDGNINRNSSEINPDSDTIEKELFPNMVNGDIKRSKIHIISQELIKPSDILSPKTFKDAVSNKNMVHAIQQSPLISTNATEKNIDKTRQCDNMMFESQNNSLISGSDYEKQVSPQSETTLAIALQVNNIHENVENYCSIDFNNPEPAGTVKQRKFSKVEDPLLCNVKSNKNIIVNDVKVNHSEEIIYDSNNDFKCKADQLKKVLIGDTVVSSIEADHSAEKPALFKPQPVKSPKSSVIDGEVAPSKEKAVLSDLNAVQSKGKPHIHDAQFVQFKKTSVLSNVHNVTAGNSVDIILEKGKNSQYLSNKNKGYKQYCNNFYEDIKNEDCNSKLKASTRNQQILRPTINSTQDTEQNRIHDNMDIQEDIDVEVAQSKEKAVPSDPNAVQCIGRPDIHDTQSVQSKETPVLLNVTPIISGDILLEKEKKSKHLSNVNIGYKQYCKTKYEVEKKGKEGICAAEASTRNQEILGSTCDSTKNADQNRIHAKMDIHEEQTDVNVNDDNVKEIASYLSTLMKKKQISNVNNKVIPKSSFHGVEKPGGLRVNKSSRKVYQRKNQNSSKKNVKQFLTTYQDQLNKIMNSNKNIDCKITLILSTNQQTFCNCSDFGSLPCDYEIFGTEHVHFANKKTNIKLENIFDADDRFTIDADSDNAVTVCNGSDSEETNFHHFICCASNYNESSSGIGEDRYCDINVAAENNHNETEIRSLYSFDLNNVINNNQPKKVFETKSTSNIASNKTEFRAHIPINNDDDTHEYEAGTSKTLKLSKDSNKKHTIKTKSNRNNKNFQELIKEKNSKSENTVVTLTFTNTKEKVLSSVTKNVSEKEARENILLILDNNSMSKKRELKQEETLKTIESGKAGSKSQSISGTEIDAVFKKKLKRCIEVEKLLDTTNNEEPFLKKHKSDKNYENRKRASTNVVGDATAIPTKQYKCEDCDEVVNDQILAKHVEDKHSFIGFDINLEKVTPKMSMDVSVNESVVKTEDNAVSKRLNYSVREQNISSMPIDKSTTESIISSENTTISTSACDENEAFKCSVCMKEVLRSKWMDHISTEHDYIAWKEGDIPLDLNDKQSIRDHLHNVSKEIGGLTCSKCGALRKYAKSYMQHVKKCTGPEDKTTISMDVSVNDSVVHGEDTSVSETLKSPSPEQTISSVPIDKPTSESVISNENTTASSPACDEIVTFKCGVCIKEVLKSKWMDHISTEHDYIAWKEGNIPLDLNDEQSIREHLHNVSKEIGGLTCSKCGALRKYAKSYMQHVKKCTGPEDTFTMSMDTSVNDSFVHGENISATQDLRSPTPEQTISSVPIDKPTSESVISNENTTASSPACDEIVTFKCGVCIKEVLKSKWMDHISTEHDYIAWKEGHIPLDLNDELSIREHLHNITKEIGGLTCSKCGTLRKYAKNYMQHIKKCTGPEDTSTMSMDVNDSIIQCEDTSVSEGVKNSTQEQNLSSMSIDQSTNESFIGNANTTETKPTSENEIFKCGVCMKEVMKSKWIDHISTEHSYIAWKDGDIPLNPNDDRSIRLHLQNIAKKTGNLTCSKCGTLRKYVKSYMAHVKDCSGEKDVSSLLLEGTEVEESIQDKVNQDSIPECDGNVLLKCGVCAETVQKSSWWNHIFNKHQYLARTAGEPPINLEDDEEVYLHLHEISKNLKSLKCRKCGRKIKYARNYMEHVKKCDETGIESDEDITLLNDESKKLRERRSIVKERETEHAKTEVAYSCGVCGKAVNSSQWLPHIKNEHQYIAWKEGDTPLDLNNEEQIRLHLHEISKQLKSLKCMKCGRHLKYAKVYMEHVRSCGETAIKIENEESQFEELEKLEDSGNSSSEITSYKCGVCRKEVVSSYWFSHIFKEHHYLAWKEGDTPLNIEDAEEVRLHLHVISKQLHGLECPKCDRTIKYAKNYMEHVKICDAPETSEDEISLFEESLKLQKSRSLLAEKAREEISSDKSIYKCGVCGSEVESSHWITHISKEHQYIAWKDGDKPLNLENDEEVRLYLQGICKQTNGIGCLKCGRSFKYAKVYMEHVKHCTESGEQNESETFLFEVPIKLENGPRIKTEEVNSDNTVTCGVCQKQMDSSRWITHISKKHQYIAWKMGDEPLNLNNEEEIRQHLHDVSRENNGLICPTCERTMKYAKNYMDHLKTCGSEPISLPLETSAELLKYFEIDTPNVDCGVCDMIVTAEQWIEHIKQKHRYLAKKKEAKPLDTENDDEVLHHLNVIIKSQGNLICAQCGLARKYSKVFFNHMKECGKSKSFAATLAESGGVGVCAMCKAEVTNQNWEKHAMEEHYNIAWVIGQTPINIASQVTVNKKLKDYQDEGNKLVCRVCGLLRISEQGFFAHIMVCGKSEEDQEVFNVVCDICNEKYFLLNKYKHMKMHKDEEEEKRMKVLAEKMLQEEISSETDNNESDLGKRRAAQKAIKVIGNLTKNISGYKFKCQKCDFGSDSIEELNSHNCGEIQNDFESDDDESVKSEGLSENESPESDIDSNLSAEEEAMEQSNDDEDVVDEEDADETPDGRKKKKRKKTVPPILDTLFPMGVKRPPFTIDDKKGFMKQSGKDFIANYYTDDVLYPEWRKTINEIVPEEDIAQCLPPLEESCQLSNDSNQFCLKRFEAVMRPDMVLFAGGCIRRVTFAPTRLDDPQASSGNFMAILCHKSTEEPKYNDEDIVSGPGLVQIWDFNNFTTKPELALGLVHDYGTIWACDWCPSGVRDKLQKGSNEEARLGLLAIACSNGSAYILSVPYPSTVVKNENRFLRANPVAELRMTEPGKRKIYQATSIKWTPQNGHETVAVGYSCGYVGYYNLVHNSPLLSGKENGVNIYYPYQEERRHKGCVSDIDIGAMIESTSDVSTISSASPSGSCLTSRSGAGFSTRCFGFNPMDRAFLSRVCPHVILAGDYSAVNKCINEIEWWGSYQRRLAIQACAECLRCGGLATYTSPVVNILKLYPLLDHKNSKIPLKMFEMVPLGAKRKIKSDEIGLVVEPRTYKEATKKYGVGVFKIPIKRTVIDSQKSVTIDRFPLADVTSMDFCTASNHHQRLAVALYAGFVIIIPSC